MWCVMHCAWALQNCGSYPCCATACCNQRKPTLAVQVYCVVLHMLEIVLKLQTLTQHVHSCYHSAL